MAYIGIVMPEISKVVHVMRRFVPDHWGGTECVVYNLSRALMKEGIDSSIFCTDMLSAAGTELYGGIPVRRFRFVFPWFGLTRTAKRDLALKGGNPFSPALFRALLKEKNLTLIHAHVQHRLGGMARTVSRLRGIPYVISLHGGYYTLPRQQVDQMAAPFRGRLEWGRVFGLLLGSRRVLADADAVICVGKAEYEAVRQRHPDKKVFYVPNGVEVKRFADADGALFRTAYGFAPDEKIVLCVSRIDRQKNQNDLVRAFADFSLTRPDHRLVLIGGIAVESYRKELQREIERRGLTGKVTVIEGLRADDPLLPSAYKASEMFVLPSGYEPFGIVVLEAWASGIPVIANRVGGIPGLTSDGRNVLLSEPGDVVGLKSRMEQLADDAALRAELARNAFEEVADYDWPQVTDQMRTVYAQIVRTCSG